MEIIQQHFCLLVINVSIIILWHQSFAASLSLEITTQRALISSTNVILQYFMQP